VKPKDVVTLCVECSIEMIIGILAILMSGAIYCPLSSNQPVDRLCRLIKQTQSHCTLVHSITALVIPLFSVQIDQVLHSIDYNSIVLEDVSHDNDIAYIIFTSGSTGTPKGVPISHRNFMTCLEALNQKNILIQNDTVLQLCAQTFDIHALEILGALWLGASLSLLRPYGHLDVGYITSVIDKNQISFIIGVPTILTTLTEYVLTTDNKVQPYLPTIRCLCSIGKFL
jgi:non-ribosomal peptide synthetase component F